MVSTFSVGPDLLNIDGAAALLGVSPATIRKELRGPAPPPSRRVGVHERAQYAFCAAELETWAAEVLDADVRVARRRGQLKRTGAITPAELAERLCVSIESVAQLCSRGWIRARRVAGDERLIDASEADRAEGFLEALDAADRAAAPDNTATAASPTAQKGHGQRTVDLAVTAHRVFAR